MMEIQLISKYFIYIPSHMLNDFLPNLSKCNSINIHEKFRKKCSLYKLQQKLSAFLKEISAYVIYICTYCSFADVKCILKTSNIYFLLEGSLNSLKFIFFHLFLLYLPLKFDLFYLNPRISSIN